MGARASASLLLKPFACLAAMLAAVLLYSPQSFGAVTFTASEIASGDTGSYSIVSGDFNNDGILDLVTVNAYTVSFYKGLGGGQYAAPVNYSGGGGSQAAAADFNGDGKLDLAIVASDNGVVILLGNGDGTFTPGATLSNEAASTTSLALADFNGDHIPDVAMNDCPMSSSECGVQVRLGNGDGTFQSPIYTGGSGYALVAGDFNADGNQDISALNFQYSDGFNGVIVLLGEGNGQFQNQIRFELPYSPADMAVGDFYDDRIQTLAVASTGYNKSGTYSAYVQTVQSSNGQLVGTEPQRVFTNSDYSDLFIIAGDLNGDFKDDIVLSGDYRTNPYSPLIEYMLGTGKGTFDAHVNLPVYGEELFYPFIRDLTLNSRHDIGLDWSTSSAGGAYVLLNTNAATNCDPPPANKLGVNVCAPKEGETVGSTFTFKGAGNAFNGIAKRMELWIDGTKVGQNLEDQLKVTTTLSAGTHTASFVVVDSFDNYTSSSVSFVAK